VEGLAEDARRSEDLVEKRRLESQEQGTRLPGHMPFQLNPGDDEFAPDSEHNERDRAFGVCFILPMYPLILAMYQPTAHAWLSMSTSTLECERMSDSPSFYFCLVTSFLE
jgi:hypothetical protein